MGGGAAAGVEGTGPADFGAVVSVEVFEAIVGSGEELLTTFSTEVLSAAVLSAATFATGDGAGFSTSVFWVATLRGSVGLAAGSFEAEGLVSKGAAGCLLDAVGGLSSLVVSDFCSMDFLSTGDFSAAVEGEVAEVGAVVALDF